MSHACQHDHAAASGAAAADPAYRRVLWIAVIVNAAMFAIEVGAGLQSGSVSLLADAVDFFGDSVSYAVSLAVLGMPLVWRARTALLKGAAMASFGVFVLGRAAWVALSGDVPEAMTMGAVGLLALAANLGVAVLLYRYRNGDANMRSVWLCTRNDALGNLAVLGAALGVFGSGSAWPDLVVASVMGLLALTSARLVIGQARAELQHRHAH